MHHPTDRIAHTTAFVTPVVEHWLEREIAQWVHPMKDTLGDVVLSIQSIVRPETLEWGAGLWSRDGRASTFNGYWHVNSSVPPPPPPPPRSIVLVVVTINVVVYGVNIFFSFLFFSFWRGGGAHPDIMPGTPFIFLYLHLVRRV